MVIREILQLYLRKLFEHCLSLDEKNSMQLQGIIQA